MKKILLVFVLAGFFYSTNAQDNLQIVDPGKMWSSMEYGFFPPWKGTTYHKFMDDTIIDQLAYLKVWRSLDENYQDWTSYGYIRSDENGDVYYLNNIFYGGLIYKFDVQVGDTFSIKNPYSWEFQVEVLSIDSVLVNPVNEYRKRITIGDFEYPGGPEEEIWIEGVGSMAGILWSGLHARSLTGSLFAALCEWQNENIVFSNPDWSYCFMTTVSTSENLENESTLSISPIPLTDNSIIKINKQLTDGRVVIVDIFGKKVKEIATFNKERISVKRNSLNPGIYIVSLYDGVRFIDRVKLLVK